MSENFCTKFVHLFGTKLHLSVLPCAIFNSLMPRMNFATKQKVVYIKLTRVATTTFVGTSLRHIILLMCKTE